MIGKNSFSNLLSIFPSLSIVMVKKCKKFTISDKTRIKLGLQKAFLKSHKNNFYNINKLHRKTFFIIHIV